MKYSDFERQTKLTNFQHVLIAEMAMMSCNLSIDLGLSDEQYLQAMEQLVIELRNRFNEDKRKE